MPTTFGTSMPSRGPLASAENLKSLAQRAEGLGYDSIWVSDHIILPRQVESFYPYAADGVATFRPDEAYYEPLAALNFLAGCTNKVRLGTHVLILPYRNPVLTAKLLSTLDVLSAGRVTLGIGVGWMEEEFQALGLDTYAQRGAVTDEYIQLFKELWTKDNPEFQGEHYQISGAGFQPKPAQKPHPPIWVGGHTGPAIRRAAKYGDGWMPIGQRPPGHPGTGGDGGENRAPAPVDRPGRTPRRRGVAGFQHQRVVPGRSRPRPPHDERDTGANSRRLAAVPGLGSP